MNEDIIYRQAAIDTVKFGITYAKAINKSTGEVKELFKEGNKALNEAVERLEELPSAQPEIIHCRECKHWRQQTNYVGAPLSFGFCESEDMWRSLYGETCEVEHIDTEDDFYCGYAERREK